MPIETRDAVNWALTQQYEIDPGVFVPVSVDIPASIVDKVREYFNDNSIDYNNFSYDDLVPFF